MDDITIPTLKSQFLWITPPKVEFDEIEVLTQFGSGRVAGTHRCLPIQAAPANLPEFDREREAIGNLFNFSFVSENMKYTFFNATCEQLNVRNGYVYTISFAHYTMTQMENT